MFGKKKKYIKRRKITKREGSYNNENERISALIKENKNETKFKNKLK